MVRFATRVMGLFILSILKLECLFMSIHTFQHVHAGTVHCVVLSLPTKIP